MTLHSSLRLDHTPLVTLTRCRSFEMLTCSAPTEDQVARAKALAEDLLVVLRIEYAKARGDTGGGGYGGGYQQQAYGQDQGQYAGYYQVRFAIPFLHLIVFPFPLSEKGLVSELPPLGIGLRLSIATTRSCSCCCRRRSWSYTSPRFGCMGSIRRILGCIRLRRK